jgi:rubrerythrin
MTKNIAPRNAFADQGYGRDAKNTMQKNQEAQSKKEAAHEGKDSILNPSFPVGEHGICSACGKSFTIKSAPPACPECGSKEIMHAGN